MALSPSTDNSDPGNARFALYISSSFNGHQGRINTLIPTEGQSGDAFLPPQLAKTLYTVQEVVSKSWLGVDPAKRHGGTDSNVFQEGGRWVNRVDQYVEHVLDAQHVGLVGWRFHYIFRDPDFSFERGLKALWEIKAKEKRPKKAPKPGVVPRPSFAMAKSVEDWALFALSGPLGNELAQPDVWAAVKGEDLESSENPAQITAYLTFLFRTSGGKGAGPEMMRQLDGRRANPA